MSGLISRRDFLKYSMAGFGLVAIKPNRNWLQPVEEIPQGERIGRICVGSVNIRSRPSADAPAVGKLYQDQLVQWNRDIIGELPTGLMNRNWVETPNGYIFAGSVQPVKNFPNQPVTELPANETEKGMWVEVSVPMADLSLENPPARGTWIDAVPVPRIYYSQVVWIDDVKVNSEGKVRYRVNEKYGNPGDIFWAPAEAFRPLTAEELTPITPEVVEKRIDVSIANQTLSAYEGNREVYFCRISSGAKYDADGNLVDKWATPAGPHPIWRKSLSIHMAGGATGNGWDTLGIAWTCLFSGDGVAIHSTFWHNNYGMPVSHGCVNTSPEDAKWIFRWTTPSVDYYPGDMTVSMPGGTIINVIDG